MSRNPMYVGLAAALVGVATLLGSITPWALAPAFVWLIQTRVIRVEEEMLATKFGEVYATYRSRVRRWI